MNGTSDSKTESSLDLVGGPFAVIESDPGVFSSLTRGFGVKRAELVELYDIEPWAVDHLDPYGLIFCFTWRKDVHRPTDFDDPAADHVWFANQLSDDACATHAILNVLFNCPDIDLGDELTDFREQTQEFSSVMRGLAITNSPLLRHAHNSLARPADIRASLNSVAIETVESQKKRVQAATAKRRPGRPPKSQTPNSEKAKEKPEDVADPIETPTYHFIGYVPAFGKVWELDGMKSGPLEVGELASESSRDGWMDVARPALRIKMAKYGGSGQAGSDIRFSLLAIVQDAQSKLTDELEYLRKDKEKIERLLHGDWQETVDPSLYQQAQTIFEYSVYDSYEHPPGFAARRMQRDTELMQMSQSDLISAWQTVLQDGMRAKTTLEDEHAKRAQVQKIEQQKRAFDYEPFFRGFITELHNQGLLNPLLNLDENGRKVKQTKRQRS